MIKSVIYLISFISLFSTFMLLKKSLKKQNVLMWIFLSFMLMFCYNSIVVFILSLFYIKSTLLLLSGINFLISIFLLLNILKSRTIQEYYLKKFDLLAIMIIVLITIIIGFLRFGFPFKIVYETCDPGTHFWTSMEFFRESILLNKAIVTVDFSARVFGSYVNMGIIFKIFYSYVGYINLYFIYILFDLFMLAMSGIIFYFLIRYICNEHKNLFALIFSIIYFIGYPLNSMIFGFFYSGHVVTLICTLILLYKFFDSKKINYKLILTLLTITNIGICFTYYLYLPILVICETIYFIYLKRTKQIDKSNLIKIFLLIIILPTILTLSYFVLPYIGNNQHSAFYQLSLDGYFYNSYFSNFILFIPIIVYYIISMVKKKKLNFEMILLFNIVGFIIIIIILSIMNIAMQYYASKFFYALWLINFVLIFDFYVKNDFKKLYLNIYIASFLLIFIFTVFSIEDKLYDQNKSFGNRIESVNLLNVYSWNIDKIKYSNVTFTVGEIEIIKELYDLGASNVINNFIQSFNAQRLWLNAFFWNQRLHYPENEVYDYMLKDVFFDPIEYYSYSKMNNNYNYFVVFYREFDPKKWDGYSDKYPYEVQRRWNDNFRKDYTINRINDYNNINRNTCLNCKFIDFDDGVIIIKE